MGILILTFHLASVVQCTESSNSHLVHLWVSFFIIFFSFQILNYSIFFNIYLKKSQVDKENT